METSERKEIIQLNGLTILLIVALIANLLIVGLVFRFHQWKLFTLEQEHYATHTQLLEKEREVKDEIVKLERVSAWSETAYVRTLGKNVRTR